MGLLRRLALVAVVALVATAAMPSAASAARLAPQGNSAVNQYTETYPTAAGPAESGGPPASGASPARALGARDAARLQSRGAVGRAAAALAAETAPRSRDGADRRRAARRSSPGGSGPLSVMAQAGGAGSSSRAGILLPLVIAASVAWSLGFLWRRKWRRA